MPYVKTTAAPSTELYYVDVGAGQPVVLIHGWPLSHAMWDTQINALADAGFRCIAYDRRGFGSSGRPTGGYDYETFAADLHDLLTTLDLRDVILAGFSMGGGEVARYIGKYGEDRIAKAMLIGAVPPFLLKTDDNPDGAPRELFDGMLAGVKKDRIGFFHEFFPNFFGMKPDATGRDGDVIAHAKAQAWIASAKATQQCITAFGTTDFRADLAKFTVPTLVIHGTDDAIVPIDISGKKSAEQIAGARLEKVKGAPHGFSATHGDELSKLMLEFARA